MSAELLLEAAALMRERAGAARAGNWRTEPSAITPDVTLVVAEWETDLRRVATCSGSLPEGNYVNAQHIASWHPAVALAVADLLDRAADDHDETPCPAIDAALAVARAYLGRDA